MSLTRLADYLDHMRQAALEAQSFIVGMTRETFEVDRRTHVYFEVDTDIVWSTVQNELPNLLKSLSDI